MPKFLFRKMIYPILIETDIEVLGAINESDFTRLTEKAIYKKKEFYNIVDSDGENWTYNVKNDLLTPQILGKRWSKKKTIDFYNDHRKNPEEEQFIGKSLPNKPLKKVINEIIEFSTHKLQKKKL